MSVTLSLPNTPDRNIKERAVIAVDVPVGSTSITLLNNQNIVNGDYCLIGNAETAEIIKVTGVTGATVALGATGTTLFHNENESFIALIGSKFNIYRATDTNGLAPIDSSFTPITTGNLVSIDPDQLTTKFTDVSGSPSFWYKFTFINPDTLYETPLTDSVAVRGGGASNYVAIEDIRKEAGFARNQNISDGDIDLKRQFAQAEINGALGGIYQVPFANPVNPLIQQIALMLAAGYLLIDQYGQYASTDTNNGSSKITWAEGMIEKLKSGQLKLQDATGIPIPEGASGVGFSGFPNSSDVVGFRFRASDRY